MIANRKSQKLSPLYKMAGILVAHFENIGFYIGSSYSKYRLFTGFSIKKYRFFQTHIKISTDEKIFDEFLRHNYSDKVDLNFTKSKRAGKKVQFLDSFHHFLGTKK